MITSEEVAALRGENPDADRCTATAKWTGKRCKKRVREGTVCEFHGANGRMKSKHAQFSAVDQFAKLYDPSSPPVTDPYLELQKLAGIARNALHVAGVKVNELERWDDITDEGARALKVEIQQFNHLLKTSHDVLKSLAQLKIDERVTEIRAAETALIGAVLDQAFQRVQLSVEQRSALDAAFAAELQAITAGHDDTDESTLYGLVEKLLSHRR